VPGGTGKTIYEFSAPANVRSEIPALTMPYSSKQRFESWRYGLPTKMQVFSQAGTLLKETVNNYSVTSMSIIIQLLLVRLILMTTINLAKSRSWNIILLPP